MILLKGSPMAFRHVGNSPSITGTCVSCMTQDKGINAEGTLQESLAVQESLKADRVMNGQDGRRASARAGGSSDMALGELLRRYIVKPKTQNQIAMAWLSSRESAEGKRIWSSSHIESQLSRLLGDDVRAVRFFFQNRESAKILLDQLEVPDDQRLAVFEEADRLIATQGKRMARLIIDLTALTAQKPFATRMFDAVWKSCLEPKEVAPAALVITNEQYDSLPRYFDRAKDWTLIEIVDDAREGAIHSGNLAGDQGLIVSSTRVDPPSRWAALRFDGTEVTLHPRDALHVFARDGALPWPGVEHDLSEIVDAGQVVPSAEIPDDPVNLRDTMFALRTPSMAATVQADPTRRLALARALGVVATSTPLERHRAEVAVAIGLVDHPLTPATHADVLSAIDGARRRVTEMACFRVEDDIHIVNPDASREGIRHPRIHMHRVDPPSPALARLLDRLASFTRQDFAQDPSLIALVEELDPNGVERRAFLHARACLAFSQRVTLPPPAAPVPANDPRSMLERLLMATLSETCLVVGTKRSPGGYFAHPADIDAARAWALPHLADVPEEQAELLTHVPPFSDNVVLQRDRPAAWVSVSPTTCKFEPFAEREPDRRTFRIPTNPFERDRFDAPARDGFDEEKFAQAHAEWESQKRAHDEAPYPLLVTGPRAETVEPNMWLDLFECSTALHDRPPVPAVAARVRGYVGVDNAYASARQRSPYPVPCTPILFTGATVKSSNVVVAPETWAEADREVALARVALRRSLEHDGFIQLPNGELLLSLPSGLVAVCQMWEADRAIPSDDDGRVRATIDIGTWMPGNPLSVCRKQDVGLSVDGFSVKVTVPRTIRLHGNGGVLQIQFASAPLLMKNLSTEAATSVGAFAAKAAAAKAADAGRELARSRDVEDARQEEQARLHRLMQARHDEEEAERRDRLVKEEEEDD